jgi:hypothetical protein
MPDGGMRHPGCVTLHAHCEEEQLISQLNVVGGKYFGAFQVLCAVSGLLFPGHADVAGTRTDTGGFKSPCVVGNTGSGRYLGLNRSEACGGNPCKAFRERRRKARVDPSVVCGDPLEGIDGELAGGDWQIKLFSVKWPKPLVSI